MKRNITINMFGHLYSIDEDAYELLQKYEESLRNYFSRREGGNEIVDDIEARIAELFDELKAQGIEAINIDHVQNIITRIGNPQQMDDNATDTEDEPAQADSGKEDSGKEDSGAEQNGGSRTTGGYFSRLRQSGKRFYRNPQDKRLTGLLGGCAVFFGGDSLLWRIGFILLFFILWRFSAFTDNHFYFFLHAIFGQWHWWLLLAYVVMACITPVADTPEDRLRMKGQTVNAQNLAQEVSEEVRKTTGQPQSGRRGCLSSFFNILALFFKCIIIFFAVCFSLTALIFLIMVLVLIFAPDGMTENFGIFDMDYPWADHIVMTTLLVVSLIGLVLIIVYGVIHSVMAWRKQVVPMGAAQRFGWTLLWLICLCTAISIFVRIGTDCENLRHERYRRASAERIAANTHGGYWMQPEDWTFLQRHHWHVVTADPNGENHLTYKGEYYTGDEDVRFLDSNNELGGSTYTVERTDSLLSAGSYTLLATARSSGAGAYVYARADGKTYLAGIPTYGNTGGALWEKAREAVAGIDTLSVLSPEQTLAKAVAEANDGEGYGWSEVRIEGIRTATGRIDYGVTNDERITHSSYSGSWFSACDFKLLPDGGRSKP